MNNLSTIVCVCVLSKFIEYYEFMYESSGCLVYLVMKVLLLRKYEFNEELS